MTIDKKRYDEMEYKRCGSSGIKLSKISLGLWHNFGELDTYENQKNLITHAFNKGIVHFDLANNYGPPPGEAERNFGRILNREIKDYRNQLFISTKAGYGMWDGPYGDFGSKKYLVSSLDDSLRRMGLDYVDLFYHHRPDSETPIEETADALELIIRQGKALYVGVSNYNAKDTDTIYRELKKRNIKLFLHQPRYNMLDRWVENELLDLLEKLEVGCIPFMPLAQGLLTTRYLHGVPSDSRVMKDERFLKKEKINNNYVAFVNEMNEFAKLRNQSITQLALSWILKDDRISSVLIGASKPSQIDENIEAVKNTSFTSSEIVKIDEIIESYLTITR